MNTHPLITTIIPTYRRPVLLKRAVSSVLSQTFRDFQVCVYDNASGDETSHVMLKLAQEDSRVKYYCHETNIGAAANFHFGMIKVETPYFNILSDDDVILPHFFEEGIEHLKRFREAILFAGATARTDHHGNTVEIPLKSWKSGLYLPPDGFFEMLKHEHPEWTGILFRKEVLSGIGYLDEETGGASDLDFELKIAAQYPIVISRRACAIFTSSPSSATGKFRLNLTWPGWIKMMDNVNNLPSLSSSMKEKANFILSERLCERLFISGLKGVLTGIPEDAIKASEILEKDFNRIFKASILRFLILDGPASLFLRNLFMGISLFRRYLRKSIGRLHFDWESENVKKHLTVL